MTDNASLALGASLLSVMITAGAGVMTHRSAAKASEHTAQTTSRTDIEKEAFDRAKNYYTDTIDRMSEDLDGTRADLLAQAREHSEAIDAMESRRAEELRRLRATATAQVKECQEEVEVLRLQLNRAVAMLRTKFPDLELGDVQNRGDRGTLGT